MHQSAPPLINDQPILRPARPDDVDTLVELASTTFRDAYSPTDDPDDISDYVTRTFTPTFFASILADKYSTLLALVAADHLIGYVQTRMSDPPDCVTGPSPIELARVYLRQETIGKGYGAVLMFAVHAEARRRGCKTIWLGVYARNQRARDFYRRWGFVDVGTKEFLFGGRSYADPVMAAPVQLPALL